MSANDKSGWDVVDEVGLVFSWFDPVRSKGADRSGPGSHKAGSIKVLYGAISLIIFR